ncbi:hypothetical protein [Candidatus Endomicrobiellum agilis]|uniref:hypothetical protein n=1 Tax=Candidatus Endomicrobiellum agilis TaxID=3238957 RepID=UPI003576D408|nr:hypothetical protein [Endomicrobium sp.]
MCKLVIFLFCLPSLKAKKTVAGEIGVKSAIYRNGDIIFENGQKQIISALLRIFSESKKTVGKETHT